jgi:hypothetical protein
MAAYISERRAFLELTSAPWVDGRAVSRIRNLFCGIDKLKADKESGKDEADRQ